MLSRLDFSDASTMNRLSPFSLKDGHTALLSWLLSLVCTAYSKRLVRCYECLAIATVFELFDDAFQLGIVALSLS